MRRQDFVCLDVHGLQCFGDTLKTNLLECSLSCGSERYLVSYGSDRGYIRDIPLVEARIGIS